MPTEFTSTQHVSSSPNFVVGSSEDQTQRREAGFVDRRASSGTRSGGSERRQFGNSHSGLSPDGRELALAIDQYKVEHHRRYLTCDEIINVLEDLGYSRNR